MNQQGFDPMTFNMMLNMMNIMHPNMGYNQNNYNFNMNNAFLMNLMMNWMKMNPNLMNIYNNNIMNQTINNNNNNNYYSNNQLNNNFNKLELLKVSQQDLNQAKVNGGGVIPKNIPKNSSLDLSSPFDQSNKINLAFTTQKGQKMNIICPTNMKIKDLFVQYILKLGLGPNVLGQSIFFLFNGAQLKKDDERNINQAGLVDGSNIIVFDLKGVIGSYNYI